MTNQEKIEWNNMSESERYYAWLDENEEDILEVINAKEC